MVIHITGNILFLLQNIDTKCSKTKKTVAIIKKAIIDAASRNNITIKEFSFGDDYSHMRLELNFIENPCKIFVLKYLYARLISSKIKLLPSINLDNIISKTFLCKNLKYKKHIRKIFI
ncbi:MAG: hypothetical protein ACP5M9_01520 [Candidatus Micrarchaeia archaeon]